jgi:hypothetical protein
MRTVF